MLPIQYTIVNKLLCFGGVVKPNETLRLFN